ncbi:hypothetical protein R3P38DRAFT_2759802 [Favolaschia claudopus]|uniref:Uncharacterized protein n=1 Tax=Favolaschia claudopus TaxID=2862362 RepID=A0AAW0DX74_9AGAR
MPADPTLVRYSKHPNGTDRSRYIVNQHRRRDWRMVDHGARNDHPRKRLALMDVLELSEEESESLSDDDSLAPPSPSTPPALVHQAADIDDTPMSPPTLGTPASRSSDDDMADLTGNFSMLSVGEDMLRPVLRRRRIEGRDALWDVPEDQEVLEERVGGDEEEEEEEVEIEKEWRQQEDADAYALLGPGEGSELTASEILQGNFIAQAVRGSECDKLFLTYLY